jgi:hypothetical protein
VVNTIYVVIGSTGEYSDRSEWPVRAYRNEAAAQAEVLRLGEAASAFYAKWEPNGYGPERHKAEDAHRATFDPSFRCDYTGTSYYLYSVELVEDK